MNPEVILYHYVENVKKVGENFQSNQMKTMATITEVYSKSQFQF